MTKIIRTPTAATGGITPVEKLAMDRITQEWIGIAMRTNPIEPDKIVPAIQALYRAAGKECPRVVIAPSPLVMAFAYGAAAAIWHRRKTCAATDAATDATTRDATDAATWAATWGATWDATMTATDAATRAATRAATDAATRDATRAATRAATWGATWGATDAAAFC